VLGLKNTRTYLSRRTLHDSSASVTILTTLDPTEPVVMTYRQQTNTQWDFIDFVGYCLVNENLNNGDCLIVDNAAVHGGLASWSVLWFMLQAYGVMLIFLPAYSPELNPCELVFAEIKRRIREYRNYDNEIFIEVLRAVASISHSHMIKWYSHCIFPSVVLLDLIE